MNIMPWIIHLTANGVLCSCCGKIEYPYIDGICDAHTEGLFKQFHHPEFQMVVDLSAPTIGAILNTLGDAVQSGARFSPQYIDGIIADRLIRLDPINLNRIPAFRVIVQDEHNRWPDDPQCEYPYNQQLLSLNRLQRK